MEFRSTNPPTHALSPIWKLSPKHNTSNLLDSYELQAITKQLNRAIRASKGLSSPRSGFYLKSPFSLNRVNRIYKENTKTCKKISCSKQNGGESTNVNVKGTRGFVLRLWKKVKQGLARGSKLHS
ncbi:hypothetical protein BUALT_Bualt02G0156800 [Buddleja alternifolia]|uniref:Ribosomal protein S14 n=1 Tax=Buddleja alternifolia TaxID=168488 RepID=A0AAV6Y794_9LAMI|nr:hypothetical protein BUALT_Bualt02G0156800 [Buddleja alternifolia]